MRARYWGHGYAGPANSWAVSETFSRYVSMASGKVLVKVTSVQTETVVILGAIRKTQTRPQKDRESLKSLKDQALPHPLNCAVPPCLRGGCCSRRGALKDCRRRVRALLCGRVLSWFQLLVYTFEFGISADNAWNQEWELIGEDFGLHEAGAAERRSTEVE